MAYENLRKPQIKAYIEELQADLEKTAGISRLKVLKEHEKLAFSSIAHLHNTWIERKAFEDLTPEQKACIAEITVQTRTLPGSDDEDPVQVDFVKLKLYDKQKALDSISKMLGYDAPTKIDHTSKGEKLNATPMEIKVYNTAPPLAGSEDEIKIDKQ
jgi:phage terminase small subunit